MLLSPLGLTANTLAELIRSLPHSRLLPKLAEAINAADFSELETGVSNLGANQIEIVIRSPWQPVIWSATLVSGEEGGEDLVNLTSQVPEAGGRLTAALFLSNAGMGVDSPYLGAADQTWYQERLSDLFAAILNSGTLLSIGNRTVTKEVTFMAQVSGLVRQVSAGEIKNSAIANDIEFYSLGLGTRLKKRSLVLRQLKAHTHPSLGPALFSADDVFDERDLLFNLDLLERSVTVTPPVSLSGLKSRWDFPRLLELFGYFFKGTQSAHLRIANSESWPLYFSPQPVCWSKVGAGAVH